jgi:hypothetical protein
MRIYLSFRVQAERNIAGQPDGTHCGVPNMREVAKVKE